MPLFTSKNQKSPDEPAHFSWKPLQTISELEEAEKNSFIKPIIIFKHSTRCSVSRVALKQFEADYAIDSDKTESYFLDLLNFRPVSNEIATKFLVEHQSPQILLIKNGKCIYHASHSDIDADEIKSIITK